MSHVEIVCVDDKNEPNDQDLIVNDNYKRNNNNHANENEDLIGFDEVV